MNSFSKLFTLAFLAAGAVLISSAASSQAQTERIAIPSGAAIVDPYHPVATCCVPAQRPINTNSTWVVKPPNGPAHAAVPLSSTPYYASPLPGSQWIGNAATNGTYTAPAPVGGQYTYTTHFCLCAAPPKVAFPVAMYLKVFSDNQFTAYVNSPGNVIGSSGPTNFGLPGTTIASVNPAFFHAGDNVITFVVTNQPNTPTGLMVSGWISGYFQQLPPGVACPHGPPIY
jgi:hypothetical protein